MALVLQPAPVPLCGSFQDLDTTVVAELRGSTCDGRIVMDESSDPLSIAGVLRRAGGGVRPPDMSEAHISAQEILGAGRLATSRGEGTNSVVTTSLSPKPGILDEAVLVDVSSAGSREGLISTTRPPKPGTTPAPEHSRQVGPASVPLVSSTDALPPLTDFSITKAPTVTSMLAVTRPVLPPIASALETSEGLPNGAGRELSSAREVRATSGQGSV